MILGRYTVEETEKLITLVDYRFGEVEKAFQRIPDEYKKGHSEEYADLTHDWDVEKAHWATVKAEAQKTIRFITLTNPVPHDLIADDDDYRRVLGFLEYGGNTLVDGKTSQARKGDLRDCQARIEKILGQSINLEGRPDIISKDVDISIFKKADTTIKSGEKGAKEAAQAAGDFVKSNPGLILGGALAAIVAGVVIGKVYL
jgi:hypothetical protein